MRQEKILQESVLRLLEQQLEKLEAQFQKEVLEREALELQKLELESLRKELELKGKKLAKRAESRQSKTKHIPKCCKKQTKITLNPPSTKKNPPPRGV